MLKKTIVFAVGFTVSIHALADIKDANESNFEKTVQAYLDSSYPRCYVYTQIPAVIDWDVGGIKAKLQALSKAGLLIETVENKEIANLAGLKKTTPIPKFELTEEGKKFYKPNLKAISGGKSIGGFCAGTASVSEITQFTEPADMLGLKVSKVDYKYSVEDLPDWAKKSEVLNAIPELKKDSESEKTPASAKATLVLTNKGWVHEKLFKK